MKSYHILMFSIFAVFLLQSSIYDIQLQDIDGNPVNLTDFMGKKILAIEFAASNPDTAQLRYLDSIQTANDSIVVIAVPGTDFGGTATVLSLKDLHDNLGLHILFTMPAAVKKEAGSGQYPLFKWLTDVNENGHFDSDADEPGQLFVIGRGGTLYGVLIANTPHDVVNAVLNQEIIE